MTTPTGGRRAVARLLVLAVAFGALIGPAASPAAAADTSWSVFGQRSFTKNSKTFSLTFSASTGSGEAGEGMNIGVSRNFNPDGAGFATESHSFGFSGLDGVVRLAQTPRTIKTGSPSQIAPFGTTNLTFDQESQSSRCNGHVVTRKGDLDGSLTLNTQTDWGSVTVNGVPNVTVTFHDGQAPACFLGGGTGGNPCPAAGKSLSGTQFSDDFAKYFNVNASRNAGANTSSMSGALSRPINANRNATGASYFAYVFQTVPLGNVQIADSLGSGTVQGMASLPLRGTGNWASTAPATTGPWEACGPKAQDKQERTINRSGKLTGGLKFVTFLGPDGAVANGPTNGFATKQEVRTAP